MIQASRSFWVTRVAAPVQLTAMISALEMVGAMLLMNREQVLWRGRGRGESSLAFFSSFFSSLPLSFGFSSSSFGERRMQRHVLLTAEKGHRESAGSIHAAPHLRPPLPHPPCLPPLPSSWVYQSSWNLSLNQNPSRSLRRWLRRRCPRCASSSSWADIRQDQIRIRSDWAVTET